MPCALQLAVCCLDTAFTPRPYASRFPHSLQLKNNLTTSARSMLVFVSLICGSNSRIPWAMLIMSTNERGRRLNGQVRNKSATGGGRPVSIRRSAAADSAHHVAQRKTYLDPPRSALGRGRLSAGLELLELWLARGGRTLCKRIAPESSSHAPHFSSSNSLTLTLRSPYSTHRHGLPLTLFLFFLFFSLPFCREHQREKREKKKHPFWCCIVCAI